jgi:hypothetical protein
MIKLDLLDYGVYLEGKHIADVEDLDHAKFFANAMAINKEASTIVINNFTGEIVTEFVVKQRIEIVEVEP